MAKVNVSRRTKIILAGVGVSAAGFGFFWYGYLGIPVYDEWHCKRGSTPVVDVDGPGSVCLDDSDRELLGERTFDPLGNRPLFCDGRRGWTEIHRGQEDDCLRDGLNMPDGWTVAPTDSQDD